ncbi:MAG: molybdopterin-dependent oxidoreductase [Fibrobacterales bacterium]
MKFPLPAPLEKILFRKQGPLTDQLELTSPGLGLSKTNKHKAPTATTSLICGYCSTGCSLNAHLKDGELINITPDPDYPVNGGVACPKGWEAMKALQADDRATTPYLRDNRGKLKETTWETAIPLFVSNVKRIQKTYGNDSVAFLSTGQIPTEEMFFLGALAKFGMNIIHGDGNTRLCMATAVVSYKQSFGFDAPPYSYEDLEESDTIFLVGSNMCVAHPILWNRIKKNKHNPKIICIDPRKTETAMMSTHYYSLAPKGDLYLFYSIASVIISNNWVDLEYVEANVNGYNEFKEFLTEYSPENVAEHTGLSSQDIYDMAEMIHSGKRVSFWWTMGVNQSHEGVRVAQALINLALITGNIGKPGTGANSITGQCNAMGSRLYSNTTNLLGGYDFLKEKDRTHVADILGIDQKRIPQENSLAYDQIIEGILQDKIKGLWLVATNTAHTFINSTEFKLVRDKLDFLVVQDMYHTTESAEFADLILPAAGWGEKDGTFINSERRIGIQKRVSKAPGTALSDFNIFRLIAQEYCGDDIFSKWTHPEKVFSIMQALSKGQPCDFSGIKGYNHIDEAHGIQWPHTDNKKSVIPQVRLFEDGKFYHADQKAKLLFEAPRPVYEPTDNNYPFTLLTGRGASSQFHSQTRTNKSGILRMLHSKEIYVEVNPEDGKKLGILPNDWIVVESRRGMLKARVDYKHTVKKGQVFIPMHYKETNRLTFPSFDKYSRQPSYKHCAVNLRKVLNQDD